MSTLVDATYGIDVQCGPYESGGNVYVILAKSSGGTTFLEAYKATDPTVSFSAQDAAHHPTYPAGSSYAKFITRKHGTNLHVLLMTSDGGTTANVKYFVFSMASDTWTVSETVQGAFNSKNLTQFEVGLEILSGGDAVAFYQGTRVRSHGNWYARCVYNKRSGGAWGGPVAVDAGGDYDYYPRGSALGASDRVHFIFAGNPPGYDDVEKSLSSGGALSAEHTFNGDSNANAGSAVYDAVNDRLYVGSWSQLYTAASSAASSWSSIFAPSAGHSWDFYTESDRIIMSVALDADTGACYAIWASDQSTPLKEYWSHNTGAAPNTWIADTDTGITPNSSGIAANIIQRGNNFYLAYVHRFQVGLVVGTYYEEIFIRSLGTPVGRATETETARTLTHSKLRVIGRATETDTSNSIHRVRFITVGRVTETEAARSIKAIHTKVIGRATETDLCRGIVAPKFITIGRITESDTSRAFTGYKVRSITRIAETETARALKAIKTSVLDRASETDAARTITASLPATAVGHWGILISN